MPYANTLTRFLPQLHEILPAHEVKRHVRQHSSNLHTERFRIENPLSAFLYAQATEKDSLRNIEMGLKVQKS